MATMLETPSRIWRRIEEVEDRDMPSLPSLSPFEDSVSSETPHTLYDGTKKSSPRPESPDLASFVSTASSHESPFEESVDPDPETPHTRRRSFLLDTNSTARPRISMSSSHDLTTHNRVNTSFDPRSPYDGTKNSSPGPELPDRASFISTTSSHEPPFEESVDPDPETPHTRRRSFLLDIDSTARPRVSISSSHDLTTHNRDNTSCDPRIPYDDTKNSSPGPEPPDRSSLISTTSSHEPPFEESVDPDPKTPHTRRRSFFLDIINSTARPRISVASSHNLTTHRRVSTSFDPRTPYDDTKNSSPGPESPDRASFISTASSHDLTTHHRVNTSFDPAMGFGTAPGHGVGRFNAAKLNNYLHGLNRRLQQENEDLTERLKTLLEVEQKEEGANRRVSSVRTSLGNVQEDVAEGWLEEKAELEDMVEKFKTGLTTCMAEKKEVETALEQEKENRERDKERWRERMTEVEQGVSGIVADLERKLDLRRLEIDDLRRAFDDRTNDLQRVEKEKDKIAMEKSDITRTVASLEADLNRVRRDAEEFVEDLKILRMENERLKTENKDEISKAERSKMQGVSGIIAGLEQKLDLRRLEIDDLRRALDDQANDLQRVEKEKDKIAAEKSDVARTVAGLEADLKRIGHDAEAFSQGIKLLRMENDKLKLEKDEMSKAERSKKQGISGVIAGLEQKLDLRRLEIDDLRHALDDQTNDLQRVEKERDKIAAENSDIARTVARLEADLKRIGHDAEAFSQDLKILRMENDKLKLENKDEISRAERSKKQGVSGVVAGLEQKLDLRLLEIDDLRRALGDKTNDLQRVEKERDKIATEKSDIARTVARLEADLKRIGHDAEAFSQDLKLLRMENDKLKTQNKDEISKVERSNQGASGIIAGLEQNLNLCRLEIDDLRHALDDRTNDLQGVEKERDKIAREKSDIARTVASLEADLKRIRRDAEAFGQDLKRLRMDNDRLKMENKEEKSKAERSKKQAQSQARLLNEQLEMQKENVLKAREEIKNYIGSAYVFRFAYNEYISSDNIWNRDERQSKMKLQHNKECKGLIVHIRYLEAKFIRESVFRSDLTYQKQYLLVLLTQFEKRLVKSESHE